MTQKYSTLLDIQHAYFALVERYFAQPFAQMCRFRVSPYEIAQQIANQEKAVRALVSSAEDMVTEFQQFWHSVHTPLESHLAALQGLKAVFGGDIAPPTPQILCVRQGSISILFCSQTLSSELECSFIR